MKLDLSFDVQAPIDAVWPALNDLDQVAPCLPGAAITGEADGAYHGEFTLKVGPFATVHRGTIRIDAADDAARGSTCRSRGPPATARRRQHALRGRRRDPRRRRRRSHVAGPLAAFVGSGVIRDVSNHLLRDFATCLAGA